MQFFKILSIFVLSIFLTFPADAAGSSSNKSEVSSGAKVNQNFRVNDKK